MSEKRITSEEVVAAYEATGIKPERGAYTDNIDDQPTCACGIGVMFVQARTRGDWSAHAWAQEVFGESYRWGFVEGFDGDRQTSKEVLTRVISNPNHDRYLQGYADGRAAAAAVFKEGATA